ncbi:MAG: hypothetical protein P4L39_09920 [Humidesulfovibrio sp.]|nr:hypothetical protein [Humidesulfovibrio sp.]
METAQAIAEQIRTGIPLTPGDAEALCQATSESDPARALARLAADADSSEAAPLLALVYSPGPEAMRTLEPALAQANLEAAGAARLAEETAHLVVTGPPVAARLPDSGRAVLAPRLGDIRDFVRRLRPEATAPLELRTLLAQRFPAGTAAELAVLLRHSRLAWTPARLFFLATLLERAESSGDVARNVNALLAWAVAFLDLAGGDFEPRAALAQRRQALVQQLRQAEFQELAQERGSFEVRLSQGMRLGHVHGPDVRAELERLDQAAALVLGLPGAGLEEPRERDLGRADDAAALLRLLREAPLP